MSPALLDTKTTVLQGMPVFGDMSLCARTTFHKRYSCACFDSTNYKFNKPATRDPRNCSLLKEWVCFQKKKNLWQL